MVVFVSQIYEIQKIPNIVGNKEVLTDQTITVNDSYTGEPIAVVPDLNKFNFDRSIGYAKKGYETLSEMSFEERIELLERAGKELFDFDVDDMLVARSGNHPISFVKEQRKLSAELLINSKKRAVKIFGEDAVKKDLIQGSGPVVIAASPTIPYITDAYTSSDVLIGGSSVILKGDSTQPISGYAFTKVLSKYLPPGVIQFITFDRHNPEKADWGSILYDECRKMGSYMVIMGNPKTPKRLAYHSLIKERGDEFLDELPKPGNILDYIGHGAVAIVDVSADLDKAVRDCVNSSMYGLKSCKRLKMAVDVTGNNTFEEKLKEEIKKLKVGNVTDLETNVPRVNEAYWENNVEPYIKLALRDGELVLGGNINEPTIIKNPTESVYGDEVPWALIEIVKSKTMRDALKIVEKYAKQVPFSRLLEVSVFTWEGVYNEIRPELKKLSYNVHLNEPTSTWKVDSSHQGKYLCQEVSLRRTDYF